MNHAGHRLATHQIVAQPGFDAILANNLLNAPGSIIFFKDLASRFIRVSVDCAAANGRTPDEMIGLTDFDLLDPTHAEALWADEQRIIATGEPTVSTHEIRLDDRPTAWVETSTFPLRDPAGTIIGTFGFSRDVTRWELAKQELAAAAAASEAAHGALKVVEDQLRAVLDGSTDAIARYDRKLRYRYINQAGERSRGSTLAELLGRTDREAGVAESSLAVYEPALRRVLESGEPDDVELTVSDVRSDAQAWFHVSLSPDRDAAGATVGVLTSMRDITVLKRAEQSLAYQALHDHLTGLANRYLLTDRLSEALVRMERHPGRLALLFVDLDHFKPVNDTFGHEVGDRLLVEVARRLERVARRGDTVARLGGDEFIVLCEVVAEDDVHEIAQRVVSVVGESFEDGEVSFRLSASVGAVVTDDPRSDATWLLQSADSAMYRAKQGGRNRFAVFDPNGPHLA